MEDAEFVRLMTEARSGSRRKRLQVVRVIRERGGVITLDQLLAEFPAANVADVAAAVVSAEDRGRVFSFVEDDVLQFSVEPKRD